MTIGTFDLTEHTQFSILHDTGLFPNQWSLCLFACSDMTSIEPFQMEYNDAVEWERQVKLARWIIEMDEKYIPKKEVSE